MVGFRANLRKRRGTEPTAGLNFIGSRPNRDRGTSSFESETGVLDPFLAAGDSRRRSEDCRYLLYPPRDEMPAFLNPTAYEVTTLVSIPKPMRTRP